MKVVDKIIDSGIRYCETVNTSHEDVLDMFKAIKTALSNEHTAFAENVLNLISEAIILDRKK